MSSVQKVFKYLYLTLEEAAPRSPAALLYMTPQCWTKRAFMSYKQLLFLPLSDTSWLKCWTHYPIIQRHTPYVNEQFYTLGLGDLLTRSKEPAENSAKQHFKLRRKWFKKQQQQKILLAGTDFWENGRLICHYFLYIILCTYIVYVAIV